MIFNLQNFLESWDIGLSNYTIKYYLCWSMWECIKGYFDTIDIHSIWSSVNSISNMLGISTPLTPPVALLACDYTQSEITNVLICWQTIHSSPASSEWLKDYVSVNFSIDTAIRSYVWSALKTLKWPSQVSSSVRISLIQLNAIVTYCTEWYLRVISCLLFHCCICI